MSVAMKFSKVSAAAALVASILVPGAARADAVAQSILEITGFTATLTNQGALGQVLVIQNGDIKSDFGGLSSSATQPNTNADFVNSVSVGPDAPGFYSPGSPILAGTVDGNYAGAAMSIAGSILVGGAAAKLDSTVSISPGGDGSATSNLNLNSGFTFNLDSSSAITFNFDAFAFLRAYLSPDAVLGVNSSANASYEWGMNIRNAAGEEVFFWDPNGVVGTGIGGVVGGFSEIADGFNLTNGVQAVFSATDSVVGPNTGDFTARTGVLGAGNYTLGITHKAVADASVEVSAIPEPGALALVSIALLGAGVASRRRATK